MKHDKHCFVKFVKGVFLRAAVLLVLAPGCVGYDGNYYRDRQLEEDRMYHAYESYKREYGGDTARFDGVSRSPGTQ